jgi:predicted DNA-binding transcriptional regulator YafY
MSKDNLISSVQSELGEDGYPAAAASALKHDLDALKREYDCRITFRRSTGCYVLEDLGELALLEVPDECMEALAFLDASFPAGTALPEQVNIRALLDRVIRLLPTSRQEEHRRKRGAVVLDMSGRTPDRVDQHTLAKLRRAIEFRQEATFEYLSLFDEEKPRIHRVAPYLIFFRPEGHGYLDATLLEVTPAGGELLHAAIPYRLDRIKPGSVKILPTMLPPQRIQPPTFTLRYTLQPVVARRRDVAAYFPNTQITYNDDGSATITATVTNLWQTRQILLRYGTACQVHEPPELVALFRETAQGLVDMYASSSNNGHGATPAPRPATEEQVIE